MTGSPATRATSWVAIVSVALLCASCEKPEEGVSSASIEQAAPATGDPPLPGIESVDRGLQRRLARALSAKGPDYDARTKHLQEDGAPRFTNRLIEESSPYLLQHAHNPVNWYPWSDEAFDRAKRENKPIFLSIGYSTCHWCHVMERESFEDEDIAAFLNRHFIAIKVDREERPDVDRVYMTAVNILAGRGGWPMTLLVTPDGQPFFGGTYFPPRKGVRGARVGLIDILTEMIALYRNDRAQVVARARDISRRVERAASVPSGPGVPSDQTIAVAVSDLATRFDRMNGGFTGAPKFPQPAQLLLLLRYARRTKDPGATAMVTTTLDRMASGGIHDHVGGGFHRYSTDAGWLVPHFEKMLYDNAQLAIAYLEAWQHTGDSSYPPIVRTTLGYVLREMTSETGAFYSATDADSRAPDGDDEEGWFFTWTTAELEDVLGKEKAAVLVAAFGVTDQGDFEGRNILHRVQTDRQVASELGMAPTKVTEMIREALGELLEARSSRPPPIRDDKIIAAWNGMMISAFARAGWSLGDASYVKAAARAAKFVLVTMRDDLGRLVRTYRDGTKATTSFLDDYAFMVSACLDLYETTGYFPWLAAALDLQREQDARFSDTEGGGYFLTANDAEKLLVRQKPAYDDSTPSGNSISAENLLRLYDLTGREQWREAAERLFASLGLRVTRSPTAFPFLLVALDRYYDVPREVAIIVSESRREGLPFAERLRAAFVPNKVFTILREREAARQATRIPWLDAKRVINGKPTAYVCERGRCELPTTRPSVFARQIDKRIPYPSFRDESPPPLQLESPR